MALLGKRKTRTAHEVWTPDGEMGWKFGHPGDYTPPGCTIVRYIKVYWERGEMGPVPYLSIRHHDGSETCAAARNYAVWFRS